MIHKRLNDLTTFSCHDNEVTLTGTDEMGRDLTIVMGAFDVIEMVDIKYIKEQTIKYIQSL
tara:strand:- start:1137 stop:1319 length:183 start_codon:yes stop_codon:yes gene_type:complete